jgi:hypothetical protein
VVTEVMQANSFLILVILKREVFHHIAYRHRQVSGWILVIATRINGPSTCIGVVILVIRVCAGLIFPVIRPSTVIGIGAIIRIRIPICIRQVGVYLTGVRSTWSTLSVTSKGYSKHNKRQHGPHKPFIWWQSLPKETDTLKRAGSGAEGQGSYGRGTITEPNPSSE